MNNNIFIGFFNIEEFLKLLCVDVATYKYNISVSPNYSVNTPNYIKQLHKGDINEL